ncbi:beta-1,4-N-acetylgalactosaminyltransferase bre-4 [Caerostris extrusa]|uniref:Beta-1,4-N-acetylgalactosaminyltransferase bre-4 n=1 Tax=Caerostris extrusa TaxID=172846 RepID=A0AAV4MH31_CAEEX|nr:beta-1,4-N-acetylgalactosaminyltransferase bre-4 [Caerostris extrusa]
MSSIGTVLQGCSCVHRSRALICKAVILMLLIVLFLEYTCNILVYKHPINKIVAPGLSWISQLNQKYGEERILHMTQSHELIVHITNSTSINNSKVNKVDSIKLNNTGNSTVASRNSTSHLETKKECPLVPPNLVGRLKVLTESPPFEQLEQMFPNLKPGGRFQPPNCIARNKVALIIPYRDREEHLRIFLHNLHPILQRQQLDYGIYVIEETADMKFNRAMLMNIGYVEALKQYEYDCFIFHDVDLIPEDDRNLYSCPEQPRHMSVAINTMNYRLPYKRHFLVV